MSIPFFGINLEKSRLRWEHLEANARQCGLHLTRVEALDGRAVPVAEWIDVDAQKFAYRHGRSILPGEYGCYRSHLRALRMAIDSGTPYAVIVEDDVQFDLSTVPLVKSIVETNLKFDVIKLVSHRTKGFVVHERTALGVKIGRTLHGPQGSAAAYVVSREGAIRLSIRLQIMDLPWDVALERYWDNGIRFYSVLENVVLLSPNSNYSEILSGGDYQETKLPLFQRLPAAVFRARDYLYRAIYTMTKS